MIEWPHGTGEEFYQWIGICITSWAKVENILFSICGIALGSTDESAAIIYYRTPTLDSRLSLTDELVRLKLPKKEKPDGGHDDSLVTEWVEIEKSIRALLAFRNAMAHQPVYMAASVDITVVSPGTPIVDDGVPPTTKNWLQIYASTSEQKRGKKISIGPITTPNLKAHYVSVWKIRERIQTFRNKALALQPKLPPPP